MRAAYLTEKTGAEGLVIGDVPKPSPDAGELLIHVRATAVTPTELQWYPTFNTRGGEPRPFPVILSHELSGVVADIGSGVTEFKAGDAVYGMNDWFANGAQAEFCTAPAVAVAPKPATLDFAEAAVVPISALTAWQGLFDHGGLKAGERVLIHGGSGGVGVFAVQLARWRGAEVVATASAERLGFVRELGADEAIDYKTTRFEEVARNIDLVLDSIGGETLERSWKVLRAGWQGCDHRVTERRSHGRADEGGILHRRAQPFAAHRDCAVAGFGCNSRVRGSRLSPRSGARSLRPRGAWQYARQDCATGLTPGFVS